MRARETPPTRGVVSPRVYGGPRRHPAPQDTAAEPRPSFTATFFPAAAPRQTAGTTSPSEIISPWPARKSQEAPSGMLAQSTGLSSSLHATPRAATPSGRTGGRSTPRHRGHGEMALSIATADNSAAGSSAFNTASTRSPRIGRSSVPGVVLSPRTGGNSSGLVLSSRSRLSAAAGGPAGPAAGQDSPSAAPLHVAAATPLSSAAHVSAARYAAPKAQAVECSYLDAVPRRGFDGVFRAAAPVTVRASPAFTRHDAPHTAAGLPADGGADAEGPAHESLLSSPPPHVGAVGATYAEDDGRDRELFPPCEGDDNDSLAGARQGRPHSARRYMAHVDGGPATPTRPQASSPTPSRAPSVGSSSGFPGGGSRSAAGRVARSLGCSSAPGTARGTRGISFTDTKAVRHNPDKLNKGLDMHAMHSSGLHCSLWIATQDGTVEVRGMDDMSTILTIAMPKRATRTVVTALLQIDGNHVAVGVSDGCVRLFDAVAAVEVKEERVHNAAVTCMTQVYAPLSPQGGELLSADSPRTPVLVTGSLDWTIGLWHARTLSPLGRLQGNRRGVSALCAAPDGCFLFSGGEDGVIRLWDLTMRCAVELSKEERRSLLEASNRAGADAAGSRTRADGKRKHASPLNGDAEGKQESFSPSSSELDSPRSDGARSEDSTVLRGEVAGEEPTRESSQSLREVRRSTVVSRGSLVISVKGQRQLLAGEGTDISPDREASAHQSGLTGESGSLRSPRVSRVGAGSTPRGTPTRARPGHRRSGTAGGAVKLLSSAKRRAKRYLKRMRILASEYGSATRVLEEAAGALNAAAGQGSPLSSSPLCFNWPIDAAHRGTVHGLVVAEGRWLVSVSRDTTAKVFALPTGRLVGELTTQRKLPLTGVTYDAAQSRVLVGATDGTVFGFDARSPAMDLVLQVRPPSVSFASSFFPLSVHTFSRLFLVSQSADRARARPGAADAILSVASVAAYDKTTLAHGPGRTFSSYRVGEPSLRELNGAMQLTKLQAQVAANRKMRESVRAMGSQEEMELRDGRRCAQVLRLWYSRQFMSRCYEKWRRCATRRSLRATQQRQTASLQSGAAARLLRAYFGTWRRFCALVEQQSHADALQEVTQKCVGDAAAAAQPVQATTWHSRLHEVTMFTADALLEQRWQALRLRYWCTWVSATQARLREERREVAYNRLLVSFNAPSSSSSMTCVWREAQRLAVRNARRQRALALLDSRRTTILVPQLRSTYFAKWVAATRLARQRAADGTHGAWALVEPLSATLVRPRELRARCFALWRAYAMFVAKSRRLVEEGKTMQQEWQTLRNTMQNPSSTKQLQAEEMELESAVAHTAFEREDIRARERVLQQEVNTLRMKKSLRVLLTGFNESGLAGAERHSRGALSQVYAPSTSTDSGRATPSSSHATGTGFTSSAALAPTLQSHIIPGAVGPSGMGAWLKQQQQQQQQQQRQHLNSASDSAPLSRKEDGSSETDVMAALPVGWALLQQVRAVLSAVKGTALQYTRDERLATAAYDIATQLPIVDPMELQEEPPQGRADPMLFSQAGHTDLAASHGSLGGSSFGGERATTPHRQVSRGSGAAGAGTTSWSVTVTSTGSTGTPRRPPSAGPSGYARNAYGQPGRVTRGAGGSRAAAQQRTGSTCPFSCLAEAFDCIAQELYSVLSTAAREAGVDLEGTNGLLVLSPEGEECAKADGDAGPPRPTPIRGMSTAARGEDAKAEESLSAGAARLKSSQDGLSTTPCGSENLGSPDTNSTRSRGPAALASGALTDTLQHSLRWLRTVTPKTRKDAMGLVLQLIVFLDSFTAHSEMSMELGGGTISTRGTSVVQALPLSCLCSEATALLLVRHAPVLLLLLQPRLWQQQSQVLRRTQEFLVQDTAVTVVDPAVTAASSAANSRRPSAQLSTPVSHAGRQGRASVGEEDYDVDTELELTHSSVHSGAESFRSANEEGSPQPQRSPAASASRGATTRTSMNPRRLPVRLSSASLSRPANASSPRDGGSGVGRGSGSQRVAGTDTPPHSGIACTPPTADCISHETDAGALSSLALPSVMSPGQTPPGAVPGYAIGDGATGPDSVDLCASVRSYSAGSTPRSMTPRSMTPRSYTPRSLTPRSAAANLSVAASGSVILKPYLGFRVNVQRDINTGRAVILVREVAQTYVNASGEDALGPAASAGMDVGDQLVRFAGYAVTDLSAFNAIVARHVKASAELPVVLMRNGEQINTTIVVGLKSNYT